MSYFRKSSYFWHIFFRTWQLGGPPFPSLWVRSFNLRTELRHFDWLWWCSSSPPSNFRGSTTSRGTTASFLGFYLFIVTNIYHSTLHGLSMATWLNKTYLNNINPAYQLSIINNSKLNLHSYCHKTFPLFRITCFSISQFVLGNPKSLCPLISKYV
jgi:hypothetical protein